MAVASAIIFSVALLYSIQTAVSFSSNLVTTTTTFGSVTYHHDRSLLSMSSSSSSEGIFQSPDVREQIFSFGPDDNDDDDDEGEDVVLFSSADVLTPPVRTTPRWHTLKPEEKERLIKEGQEKAIRNKKKREPKAEKKRRLLMQFKESQRKDKLRAKVRRPLPLQSTERTPFQDVVIGSVRNGTVISLTDFGAYVDVGTTECDGLVHVSQMSREVGGFVSHPRQVMKPGDKLENLTVTRAELPRSLQLTMLTAEERQRDRYYDDEDEDDEDDDVEKIALDTLYVDDELWGEVKRVTNYGAYVELGAEVDGFLHFMDHPTFSVVPGQHPSEYMAPGQRVRVWVSHVDLDKNRIKLTALRPRSLPRLKRDMIRS